MRQILRNSRAILFIALPAISVACSDPESPPPNPLVGSYTATTWTTTGNSGQQSQLVSGSTLQITLNANHTTSGHLHIPAQGGSPAFDADMAGTWSSSGDVVDFTQAADTFVRDMLFTMGLDIQGRVTLSADQTFSGTDIQIILTKTS